MSITTHMVIFDTNAEVLARLADANVGTAPISTALGTGIQVSSTERLDALLITLMQAAYLGAAPPFPKDCAFVLRATPGQVDQGFPQFFVAGVHAELKQPRAWLEETTLFVTAALEAIRGFNRTSTEQIRRIGVQADNLNVGRLGEARVMRILEEALVSP